MTRVGNIAARALSLLLGRGIPREPGNVNRVGSETVNREYPLWRRSAALLLGQQSASGANANSDSLHTYAARSSSDESAGAAPTDQVRDLFKLDRQQNVRIKPYRFQFDSHRKRRNILTSAALISIACAVMGIFFWPSTHDSKKAVSNPPTCSNPNPTRDLTVSFNFPCDGSSLNSSSKISLNISKYPTAKEGKIILVTRVIASDPGAMLIPPLNHVTVSAGGQGPGTNVWIHPMRPIIPCAEGSLGLKFYVYLTTAAGFEEVSHGADEGDIHIPTGSTLLDHTTATFTDHNCPEPVN